MAVEECHAWGQTPRGQSPGIPAVWLEVRFHSEPNQSRRKHAVDSTICRSKTCFSSLNCIRVVQIEHVGMQREPIRVAESDFLLEAQIQHIDVRSLEFANRGQSDIQSRCTESFRRNVGPVDSERLVFRLPGVVLE